MAMPLTVQSSTPHPGWASLPPCPLAGCLHLEPRSASRAAVAGLQSRLCYAATFPLFTGWRRCLGRRIQFTEWH